MKRLSIFVPILLVLVAIPAMAQKTSAKKPGPKGNIVSPGELTPTPEMWFYEQFRLQHQDPKAMVRKRAEFRASQRQSRIAMRKWFGFSVLRPTTGTDPFLGYSGTGWSYSSANYPYYWIGPARPGAVIGPYGPWPLYY